MNLTLVTCEECPINDLHYALGNTTQGYLNKLTLPKSSAVARIY